MPSSKKIFGLKQCNFAAIKYFNSIKIYKALVKLRKERLKYEN